MQSERGRHQRGEGVGSQVHGVMMCVGMLGTVGIGRLLVCHVALTGRPSGCWPGRYGTLGNIALGFRCLA
jgi:hypothetical protein